MGGGKEGRKGEREGGKEGNYFNLNIFHYFTWIVSEISLKKKKHLFEV